jgi:hypothetical protein
MPGGRGRAPGGNGRTPGGSGRLGWPGRPWPGWPGRAPGGRGRAPGGSGRMPGGRGRAPGGNGRTPGGSGRPGWPGRPWPGWPGRAPGGRGRAPGGSGRPGWAGRPWPWAGWAGRTGWPSRAVGWAGVSPAAGRGAGAPEDGRLWPPRPPLRSFSTTSAGTVDEWLLTSTPMLLSRWIRSLFCTPSSLAISYTRGLLNQVSLSVHRTSVSLREPPMHGPRRPRPPRVEREGSFAACGPPPSRPAYRTGTRRARAPCPPGRRAPFRPVP